MRWPIQSRGVGPRSEADWQRRQKLERRFWALEDIFLCATTVPHRAVYVPQSKPFDVLDQVAFEAHPCPTLLYVPLPLFPVAVRLLLIPADICGYLRIFADLVMYAGRAKRIFATEPLIAAEVLAYLQHRVVATVFKMIIGRSDKHLAAECDRHSDRSGGLHR